MVVFGASFVGLLLLPVDFPYWAFALLTAANGIGGGMFAAPNSASIMSSVPARYRGAASGMRATYQNSGTALSIGVFFSLMIAGLAGTLPQTLTRGLQPHGVPHAIAQQIGTLPPVSSLFAAVLGVNPVQHLLSAAGVLAPAAVRPASSADRQAVLPAADIRAVPSWPGRRLPSSAALAALAGVASLLRGGRYVHQGSTRHPGWRTPHRRPPRPATTARRSPCPALFRPLTHVAPRCSSWTTRPGVLDRISDAGCCSSRRVAQADRSRPPDRGGQIGYRPGRFRGR